ncbi:4162_t:CDS:2 [Diversispora eburnea]|uniref:4162_t:CDS:1 n=1 Tax=Diversispora eburnea TaxID=1213867 RepID=A0A9N8UW87_9GLOM|nr:4162_t:CDS:2 [Diversispora eburnea]
MYHPPRGGVRGGRTSIEKIILAIQFLHQWEGKDLNWYSKEGEQTQAQKDELRAIKEAEADKVATGNVTQQELSNVLKREQDDDEEDNENIKEATMDAAKGLGFKSSGRILINEMIPGESEAIVEEFLIKKDDSRQHTNEHNSVIMSENLSEDHSNNKDKHRKHKEHKEYKKNKVSQQEVELSDLSNRDHKRHSSRHHFSDKDIKNV